MEDGSTVHQEATGVPAADQIGWQGTINAWECDEMGRLELRFYVALAWQGALVHAARLGWSTAPGAVVLIEQHIRFHRELRPNIPAHLTGTALAAQDWEADILQRLVRSDTNETVATLRTLIYRPTTTNEANPPAPVPRTADIPSDAGYRGLDPARPLPDALDVGGLVLTARGIVLPQDCNAGRMRCELVLGRVAEATPHLVGPFNQAACEATGLALGGASVECRLRYLAWPREGDQYEVRSAIIGVDRRTQRLAHFMVDPSTGRMFATVEVVALMLDLDARRAAQLPEEVLDAMRRHITPLLS